MNATSQTLSNPVTAVAHSTAEPTQSIARFETKVKKVRPVCVDAEPVHRVMLHDYLVSQVGRFIGVDFIKVDGSERQLNGRLGVRKHLQGGSNTVAALDRPYLVVYDVKTKGYRAVNLATVSAVRAQHTRRQVIG